MLTKTSVQTDGLLFLAPTFTTSLHTHQLVTYFRAQTTRNKCIFDKTQIPNLREFIHLGGENVKQNEQSKLIN